MSPLRRVVMRNGSAYESARYSPERARVIGSAPTDAKNELTPYTLDEIRRKSRTWHKNSGTLRASKAAHDLYAVGNGIIGRPTAGDAEWNKRAREIWADFCERPDISNRFNFTELQSIICQALDVDGEIFAVKVRVPSTDAPRVQLIHAHRCVQGDNDPEWIDGIKFDAYNRPVAYRFLRDDDTIREVPAGAVLHIYAPEYYDGARATPPMQHALNAIQDEREVIAADFANIKESARHARILKLPPKELTNEEFDDYAGVGAGAPIHDPAAEAAAKSEAEKEALEHKRAVEGTLGGATLVVEHGTELSSYDSKIPNPNTKGFLEWSKREASGGGIPYEFIHEPGSAGGAGIRLVTGRAERVFSKRTRVIIDRFCKPLLTWVLADAIADGELDEIDRWWSADWIAPRSVTVDAGRDRKADRDDLILGNRTFSEDFGEYGLVFEDQLELRAREARLILDAAERHKVPLGMLWNPAPSSQPATPSTSESETTETTTETDEK